MAKKIISWNVNGIRASVKKDFFSNLENLDADVLCLQESKAQLDQIAETIEAEIKERGYFYYANSAERKGYSGTITISKEEPLAVHQDIGVEGFDDEGRVLTLEFEDVFVVNVYVPNSGDKLARLDYRSEWDKHFLAYLQGLEARKPVLVCGDFNVAHTDIDLARPKQNYNKSAGYTQVEIDGLEGFLKHGFIDTFRLIYPDTTDAYSWWSYRGGAREKNVGWRIDYILASAILQAKVDGAFIRSDILGSDHCPVGISLQS